MTRVFEGAAPAVMEALSELWDFSGLCDEVHRFESESDVAIAYWLACGVACRRWVATVTAAGRTRDLPPILLDNRDTFNAHDWRIPCP